jgi:hypothetical protein
VLGWQVCRLTPSATGKPTPFTETHARLEGVRRVPVHLSQRVAAFAGSAFRIAGFDFRIVEIRPAALRQIFSIRESRFHIEGKNV